MKTMFQISSFLYDFLTKVLSVFGLYHESCNMSSEELGPWALVTGATDGIGKEYAEQLAAMGLNIVLVSRTESKLGHLAIELNSKYGIQVRTIAVDFTAGSEIYPKIQLALEGLEIGTLINNVGMSSKSPGYFHEGDDAVCVELLNCNLLSTTMMIKMLLPSMVSRGKGYIVNVGSLASEVSFPFLSLYAASKAYVDKLSHDLGLEYGNQGIFIQSLVPCCVATKMSHIQIPSFFAPSAQDFVKSALKSLRKNRRTTGYYSHTIQLVWFRFLRICFGTLFENYNYSVMNMWREIAKAKVDRELLKVNSKLS